MWRSPGYLTGERRGPRAEGRPEIWREGAATPHHQRRTRETGALFLDPIGIGVGPPEAQWEQLQGVGSYSYLFGAVNTSFFFNLYFRFSAGLLYR